MLSKAIAKLKNEMEINKNNPYFKVIGEYLLQLLDKNPNSAEKILVKEKTIKKSLDEMRKFAEKKKVGNCAVLTDQEGFEVVLKYYEIDSAAEIKDAKAYETKSLEESTIDFNIKLDDLLGE